MEFSLGELFLCVWIVFSENNVQKNRGSARRVTSARIGQKSSAWFEQRQSRNAGVDQNLESKEVGPTTYIIHVLIHKLPNVITVFTWTRNHCFEYHVRFKFVVLEALNWTMVTNQLNTPTHRQTRDLTLIYVNTTNNENKMLRHLWSRIVLA